ncbi:hypothetical protein DZF91_18750 [Actinomadura logoneensis]|uniref:DUF4404 family protein n=1 Tax=Actinomadura logoneensis TaxID=2293572 RepID=A0A372JJC2_9ACTN|nr:DUF5955 family protein [Actinomadura logoneensis]RFU40123.1 hypothetical protein DZF91_18750 [Actinomadura logoneensis]
MNSKDGKGTGAGAGGTGRRGDHRGVRIGGNARVSGQISTGDHSVQIQGGPAAGPPDGTAAALARVAELIDAHEADLPEAARARRDLADVREEAETGDPDTDRMSGALDRLARRVGGVAALAEAVHALATRLGLA